MFYCFIYIQKQWVYDVWSTCKIALYQFYITSNYPGKKSSYWKVSWEATLMAYEFVHLKTKKTNIHDLSFTVNIIEHDFISKPQKSKIFLQETELFKMLKAKGLFFTHMPVYGLLTALNFKIKNMHTRGLVVFVSATNYWLRCVFTTIKMPVIIIKVFLPYKHRWSSAGL